MKGKIIGITGKEISVKLICYFETNQLKYMAYINDVKKLDKETIKLGIVKLIANKTIVFEPENSMQYQIGIEGLEQIFSKTNTDNITIYGLDDIKNVDLISAKDTTKTVLDYPNFFKEFIFENPAKASFLKDLEDLTVFEQVNHKEESNNEVVNNEVINEKAANQPVNNNVISNETIVNTPIQQSQQVNPSVIKTEEKVVNKEPRQGNKKNLIIIVVAFVVILLLVLGFLFKDNIIGLFAKKEVKPTPVEQKNELTCTLTTNHGTYAATNNFKIVVNYKDNELVKSLETRDLKFTDKKEYNDFKKQTVTSDSSAPGMSVKVNFDDTNFVYKVIQTIDYTIINKLDLIDNFDKGKNYYRTLGYTCNNELPIKEEYKEVGNNEVRPLANLDKIIANKIKLNLYQIEDVQNEVKVFSISLNNMETTKKNVTLTIKLYDKNKNVLRSKTYAQPLNGNSELPLLVEVYSSLIEKDPYGIQSKINLKDVVSYSIEIKA